MPARSQKTYNGRGSASRTQTASASPAPVPVPVRPTGPFEQLDYVDIPVLSDEVRRLYNLSSRKGKKVKTSEARQEIGSPEQLGSHAWELVKAINPSNSEAPAEGSLAAHAQSERRPMTTLHSSSDSDGFVVVGSRLSSGAETSKPPASNGKPARQSSLYDNFEDDDDDDERLPDAIELIPKRRSSPVRPVKDTATIRSPDKGKSKALSPIREKSASRQPITSWAPNLQQQQKPKKKKTKGALGLFRNFDDDSVSDEDEGMDVDAPSTDKGKGKAVESAADKGKRKSQQSSESDVDDDMPRPRSQPAKPSSGTSPKKHAPQKIRSQPTASSSKDKDRAREKLKHKKKIKGRTKGSDLEDDLRSNLNVDAFVRSTKDKELAKRKKGLEAFRKRRQKLELSDSDDDESESESESSSSLSSASSSESSDDVSKADSLDFIVENDDEVSFHAERDRKLGKAEGAPARAAARRREAEATKRRLNERDAIMQFDLDSPFRRQTLDELCGEYVRWLVLKILDVKDDDKRRAAALISCRAQLQRKQKDTINALGSMAMRRQFYWVLRHYPHCEIRSMTRDERLKHVGCAACKRSKQTCESYFTFHGRLYDPDTLEWREDDSSSAMSTDGSDLAERDGSGRDQRLSFYLGRFCATRARHLHSLYHWEYNTLSTVNKLPSLKTAKRANKAQALLTQHIEDVVDDYAKTLVDLIKSQESTATVIVTGRIQ